MNILNIDTATDVFGLGLLTTKGLWFDTRRKAGLKHAEVVMGVLDRTLAEAQLTVSDLDLIVCAKGPGSFTGLRIGMAAAKGVSSGLGVPMVSITTLDAMAFGLGWFPGAVVPVIDARKKRLYTSVYVAGKRVTELLDVTLPEFLALIEPHESILLTGPACDIALGACGELPGVLVDPRGASGWNREYIELGVQALKQVGPDSPNAGPAYLRKSDAELNLESRREKV